jgi:hypothetical protein
MKQERIPEFIAEVRDELAALIVLCASILSTAKRLPDVDDPDVYKESLALKLHNYYTGCERIFERIAGDMNGEIPQSADWHRRLLHSMALKIDTVRPAVISRELEKLLGELLSFRHVLRNLYGFELDVERIQRLVDLIEPTHKLVERDINRHLTFLESLL